MEPGRHSLSAMGSALLRAAHVREDEPPWVFEDTVSASLLGSGDVARLEASMAGWTPEVRRAWRVAHAVRARLAEDVAVEGLAVGRREYVLLGAGLDTFAWRHSRAGEFRVRELDHPETQAWKRAALRRMRMPEPDNLRFVPVDLSETALDDVATPPLATWNWLGVTMYLPRTATETALRAIASRRSGTTLVVNFALPVEELDDELSTAVSSSAASVVAAADEPVVACYTAAQAESMLREAGFSTVTVLDVGHASNRYLHPRLDLCLPDSTVIAVATV